MCVGCRRRRPQPELVRLVADPVHGVALGLGQPGRGAWLCADTPGCVDAAARKDALGRALRCRLDETAYARLRSLLARWAENRPDMRE